jgi:hypothetical protein
VIKFAIVFGFSGLYMDAWDTLESATAATLLPSSTRDMGFDVLATVNGVGDLLSSTIVGTLWILDSRIAMTIVIAASLIGASVIARTRATAHLEKEHANSRMQVVEVQDDTVLEMHHLVFATG